MTKPLSEQVAELRADVEAIKAGKHKSKKPKKRVPEPVARGSRTTVQAALAVVVASWLNPYLPHVVDHQKAWLIGALTALFSLALTWLEDRTGKSILRQAPPTTAPVVDN